MPKIKISDILLAEVAVQSQKEEFLRQEGWRQTCSPFGWYWTWEKTTEIGTHLITITMDEAFRMEKAILQLADAGKKV